MSQRISQVDTLPLAPPPSRCCACQRVRRDWAIRILREQIALSVEREREGASERASERAGERASERARLSSTGEVV